MDNNEAAKKLADWGRDETRHRRRAERHLTRATEEMAKVAEVQAERCAFLQSLVPDADLDPEVVAFSVAPKDD